jgi:hypothetical protein
LRAQELILIKDLTSLEFFASQIAMQHSAESLKAALVEPMQVNGSLINFVQIDTAKENTNVFFEVHTKDPLEFLKSPLFSCFLQLFETNLNKFSWSENVPWGSLILSNTRIGWTRDGNLVPTPSTSKQLQEWPEFKLLLEYLERVIRSTQTLQSDRTRTLDIEIYHDGISMYFSTKILLEKKPRESLPFASMGSTLALFDLSLSDRDSNRGSYELSMVGIVKSNSEILSNGILVLQPNQGLNIASHYRTKIFRGAS